MQLLALVGSELGEECVLGVTECLVGLLEAALARLRDGDEVSAPVDGVSLALDEPLVLERVEQVDQDAVVDAHELSELALAYGATVGKEIEDAKLPRLETVRRQHFADVALEALAEDRERETGSGAGAVEDLAGFVGTDGRHGITVAPIVVRRR